MLPAPIVLLRLITFTVPAALAVAAVQPLLAAAAGGLPLLWALELAIPSLVVAAALFWLGRLATRRELKPPWFSAYALLPGAFLLAGAAAMCVYGALVPFAPIRDTSWALLILGAAMWETGLLVVVRRSV